MKSKEEKNAQINVDKESETPAARRKAISELFKAAGIKSTDRTKENLGKTSITFVISPSPESQDKAETALHYSNQRKGS